MAVCACRVLATWSDLTLRWLRQLHRVAKPSPSGAPWSRGEGLFSRRSNDTECRIDRLGIGKHLGDVWVQDHHIGRATEALVVLPAPSVAEVVFREDVRIVSHDLRLAHRIVARHAWSREH